MFVFCPQQIAIVMTILISKSQFAIVKDGFPLRFGYFFTVRIEKHITDFFLGVIMNFPSIPN